MTIFLADTYRTKVYTKPRFYIDPLIPGAGVGMLHAKSSVGKTPVTWHMAACISSGTPFFGLRTTKGRVLYIDCDNTEWQNQDRFAKLTGYDKENFMFWFPNRGIDVRYLPRQLPEELRLARRFNPDVIFWNTLDRIQVEPVTNPDVPARVYRAVEEIFPERMNLIVHHENKSNINPELQQAGKESFTGSQGWYNNAVCMIRLVGGDEGMIDLLHTKSQVSRRSDPIPLKLDLVDGVTLSRVLLSSPTSDVLG